MNVAILEVFKQLRYPPFLYRIMWSPINSTILRSPSSKVLSFYWYGQHIMEINRMKRSIINSEWNSFPTEAETVGIRFKLLDMWMRISFCELVNWWVWVCIQLDARFQADTAIPPQKNASIVLNRSCTALYSENFVSNNDIFSNNNPT